MKFLIRLFLLIFLVAVVLSGCGEVQIPGPAGDPNYDFDTAQSIQVDGTEITSSIGFHGDYDFYKFTSEVGYGYCIRVKWVSGQALDLHVRCYDSEENVIYELDDSDETQDERGAIEFHDTGGTCYLEITDYSDTNTGEYQISVVKGDLGTIFELEPNNDFDSAQSIPVNGTEITATIGSGGDNDYYKFTGEVGYGYCVRLTWLSGDALDLYGDWFDSNFTWMGCKDDFDAGFDEIDTIDFHDEGGVCYLAISDFSGNNIGKYKISVTKGDFGTAN